MRIITMHKKAFITFLLFFMTAFLFAVGLDSEKYKKPVKYDKSSGEEPSAFFEREYSELWDSLPEYEQFAIACSSNVFERNGQFHLDFCNRIVFDKNTHTGKSVLNDNWEIFNYEELMENFRDLTEGEQNKDYIEFKQVLEEAPDQTVLKYCSSMDYTITAASRMYYVRAIKDLLGSHNLEAWIDARAISILRWGIGAGYIREEEACELIKTIVQRIKDDYCDFEDFICHWIAGYCYNLIKENNTNETVSKLKAAVSSARAYIPFEKLPFTGKNADKEHRMTYDKLFYQPDEEAQALLPVQLLYNSYKAGEYDKETLKQLKEYEAKNEELANLTCNFHLDLLQKLAEPEDRISYIESKWAFISSLKNTEGTYAFAAGRYMSDSIMLCKPQKLIDLYEKLPPQLQTDKDYYFDYGYAYYLMAILSSNILERDIYISRAVGVFAKLRNMDYNLGFFINSWLNAMESL